MIENFSAEEGIEDSGWETVLHSGLRHFENGRKPGQIGKKAVHCTAILIVIFIVLTIEKGLTIE